MMLRVVFAFLLGHALALGARLREAEPDVLPLFSKLPCEDDLCVLVTFADGSSDILETNQEKINGKKLDVFKGKAVSTGNKAVIIPRDNNDADSEETIVFKSLKAGGCTRFSVDLNGNATSECLNNDPGPSKAGKGDELEDRHVRLDYLPEDSSMDRSLEEMELAPRELDPNGYKLKVAVYYDDMFAEEFKDEAESRVAAIMAIVDEMYSEKDTLKTEIEVITVAIEHAKGENWGIVYDWETEAICESCSASQIAHDSELDVNLYVFMTGSRSIDGNGLAHMASVCSKNKIHRVSINKYTRGGKRGGDAYTAATVAHEIGHNLGMGHDCLDDNCFFWKPSFKGQRVVDGQKCYGYMDYIDQTNYWSPCSVSDFASYINRQPRRFCLEKIKPDDVDNSVPSGPIVCNNIRLKTRNRGDVMVWSFGSCISEMTYRYNKTYNIECCQPEGEYKLKCIDNMAWCHGGEGWYGGYIQIGDDETRYCEDFEGGGVQSHEAVKHTASLVDMAYLKVKLTTKLHADQLIWTIGPCSSLHSELGPRYRLSYIDNREYESDCYLPAGTYDLICRNDYGDGWNGAFIEIAGTKYCGDFHGGDDGFQKTVTVTVE